MKPEKVKQVLSLYREVLARNGIVEAVRLDALELNDRQSLARWSTAAPHLAWMCEEATILVETGRIPKAMRWLGFIQGVFAAMGLFSIDELANHSRPDGGSGERT